MADNNNSPKKGWVARSIDDGFDSARDIVHTTWKRKFNLVYLIITFTFLYYVGLGWSVLANGISGLLGWERKESVSMKEQLGERSYEAGSYLREVSNDHRINISVEYIGDDKRRNSREPRNIRLDDLNNTGDSRVIRVRDER